MYTTLEYVKIQLFGLLISVFDTDSLIKGKYVMHFASPFTQNIKPVRFKSDRNPKQIKSSKTSRVVSIISSHTRTWHATSSDKSSNFGDVRNRTEVKDYLGAVGHE